MTDRLELTVSRVVPAAPKEVFEAWLDPAVLAKFMLPAAEMPEPSVELDPRVGGSFLIVMKAGDRELPHRGEYKEIERYDRLVFTWLSGATVDGSTVTLDFEPAADGATKVTLHHVGFPSEESRDNHNQGWTRILETEAHVLG